MIGFGAKDPEYAIFCVGRSGSGKTTLCMKLAEFGFSRISASGQLRKLYEQQIGPSPSRKDLADFGEDLRLSRNLDRLNYLLASEMRRHHKCCIDGVRFWDSFESMRFCAKVSRLIFMECSPNVREMRLRNEQEPEWLIKSDHPTEVAVQLMQSKADLVVNADAPLEDVVRQVSVSLREWRMV